jgi:hypothetical protein
MRKMMTLQKHAVILNATDKELSWIQKELVHCVMLSNRLVNLEKIKKENLALMPSAKNVDMKSFLNLIMRLIRKSVTYMQQNGQKITGKRLMNAFERITVKILRNIENVTKQIGNSLKKGIKHIEGAILKRYEHRINYVIMSKEGISKSLVNAPFVLVKTGLKLITLTTQNLLRLYGYVEDVILKFIKWLKLMGTVRGQVLRLRKEMRWSELARKPQEKGFKYLFRRLYRSVGSAGLKVTERLRHTAGCNFWQGQCITNDLWVQNLRSTGLLAV